VSQDDLSKWFGGVPSWANIDVDRHSAIGVSAVWACVRLISETIAAMPLKLYRRVGDGKEPATEHPLYRVLHDAPNPMQTSFLWREQSQGHLLLQGNQYSQIVRDGIRPVQLWPLDPEKMAVSKGPTSMLYEYQTKAGAVKLGRGEVLHIPGLGWDGICGYPVIQVHAQSLGSSIAGERYAAEFFGNSASPDGFITMQGALKDKNAQERMQRSWEDAHGAWGKKHRTAILEQGAEWKPISIPPEQAQFIETRKYNRSEVASIFRVPPHLIGDVERSTSWGTGIEQQSIGFVVFTMLPWLTRWEQSLNQQLLLEDEREDYFFEFLVTGLLRGDAAARSAFYHQMLLDGVLNADEVRAMENMNPQPEGQGKAWQPSLRDHATRLRNCSSLGWTGK
jgi:HK97 family phage portal protein